MFPSPAFPRKGPVSWFRLTEASYAVKVMEIAIETDHTEDDKNPKAD